MTRGFASLPKGWKWPKRRSKSSFSPIPGPATTIWPGRDRGARAAAPGRGHPGRGQAQMDRAHALAPPPHQPPRPSSRRACCAWPIASTPTRCPRPISWSRPAARPRCRISAWRASSTFPSIFCGSLLRGLGPENFNLIVSSYDRDAGSDRHMVVLKPSAIDPDALGRPASVPRYGPERRPQARGPADRRQCRAVPLPAQGMGAPARLRRRDFEGLGHALAHLDLAAHAGLRRRQDRRACQGRERRRPLHRLPHGRAGHAAADLRRRPKSSSAPRIRAR